MKLKRECVTGSGNLGPVHIGRFGEPPHRAWARIVKSSPPFVGGKGQNGRVEFTESVLSVIGDFRPAPF